MPSISWFRQPLLYLVRHGETEYNAQNLYRSWSDVPLNEEGLKACAVLANWFSYARIGQVHCHPLQRAVQTAEAILPFAACPYLDIDPAILPWSLGDLAGQPKNAKNRAIVRRLIANPLEQPPGDPADGESLDAFRQRWGAVFNSILYRSSSDCPDVIVCSTSNISYADDLLNKAEDRALWQPEERDLVEPGGIVAVYQQGDGYSLEPLLGAIVSEVQSEAS